MILDVGCGTYPVGDVNVDLYIRDEAGHRSSVEEKLELNTKEMSNFVLCDAKHLPFQNNVFQLVACRQTIEHIPKPALLTKELVRVSKNKVVIETIHYFGERLQYKKSNEKQRIKKVHINKFGFNYFQELAKIFDCDFKAEVLSTIPFPHKYLSLVQIPLVIRVTLIKQKTIETQQERQSRFLLSLVGGKMA